MSVYGWLDEKAGGLLPGGQSPGQVGYSDTGLAVVTGGLTAIAATPVAIIGGGLNALVTGGEVNPLTTWAGAYNLGSGQGAGSIGDGAWKVSPGYTPGDFSRDWAQPLSLGIYQAPGNDAQREPGTQHGNVPLWDFVKEKVDDVKDIGKGLAALAAIAVAVGLKQTR